MPRPAARPVPPARAPTLAEAVVWSTKIAPARMPARAPSALRVPSPWSAPSTTERRSSSLPTQQNTMSAPWAAAAVSRRWTRRHSRQIPAPGGGLGGVAVVDRDLVAGPGQVAGHGITHDAEAEEADFARCAGCVGFGLNSGHGSVLHGAGGWDGAAAGRHRAWDGAIAVRHRGGGGAQTMAKFSVPALRSCVLPRWLLSLICSRRSLSESALRSASS